MLIRINVQKMTLHRFFQKVASSLKKATGIGLPALNPGETVDTNNAGDVYSGNYYVDGVSHGYHENSNKQHFALKRNATGNSDIRSDD